MRGLLLIALLVTSVSTQEIQVKKVMDFSGGLVNSISNANMRDNMAVVLKDYDIDPFGNLKRRQGMRSSGGGLLQVLGLFPYITNEQKDLMILTRDASNPTCNITLCELYTDTSRCTTMVDSHYYDPSFDWNVPFNISSFIYHDTLYFVETNSDMFYWGGDSVITVRPFDTIQIRGVPANLLDSLKDQYEYVYEQRHRDTAYNVIWQYRDTSFAGLLSWPVFPHYGSVLLWNLPLDTLPDKVSGAWSDAQVAPYDSVFLYRRDSPTDSLLLVASWLTVDSNSTFEDTVFIADSTDTLLTSLTPGPPDSICEESLLSFQPDHAVLHGNRVYAIGNPEYRNRLYFSNFGRPTNWPCSNFINVPSRISDWLVHLLPLEDRLILFRHSSVLQLTGHTFYQYSVDEIANHVGLSSPRSVATVGNNVYFYHSSGVYTLGQFGGISADPISFQIQKSVDSLLYSGPPTVGQQLAVGSNVNNEYWFSLGITAGLQATYIYSEFPIPYWRSYGFGFQQIVRFDTDTTSGIINPNRWLVARIGDPTLGPRLWRLERDRYYSFVNNDTMDVYISNVPDTTYYAIEAVYQSKRFFEGRERERVYWLDIVGEGDADTITFTFLDEGVAFDTVLYLPNFTDGIRDRIVVDHIVSDFAVRWQDNGHGQYTIKGYEIGWIPWDRGRPAP